MKEIEVYKSGDDPKTQIQEVVIHLFSMGVISSRVAFIEYGISRLSHIIYKLRKKGFVIESVPKEFKNKFENVTRYVEYKFINGEELLNGELRETKNYLRDICPIPDYKF